MALEDPSNALIDQTHRREEPVVARRSANYQPNTWDYASIQTLTSDFTKEEYGPVAEELKDEVRRWFDGAKPWPQLRLIDAVTRLGLGYHFEKEIKRALHDLLASGYHSAVVVSHGLHATAVCFRLLRQHGFLVSEEIFNHFKDEDGSFMASLSNDVRGLLSLYEASHLAFDGENVLAAANKFASRILRDADASSLASEVSRELELPSHWRISRLEARLNIDVYESGEAIHPTLLRLAKLDFNLVQSIHQKELRKVTSWWMSMDLGKKMSFIRDRIMECFFAAVGIVFNPQFGYCREEFTKICMLIAIVDDVYDVYGSIDELELFTRVIDRWELKERENLPEYMKACFYAIHNTTEEMAYNIQRYNGWEILPSLKKAWADLCKAFLVEANWYINHYKPTIKEYLDNGWVSSSGPLMLLHVYFLLIQKSKEASQCLDKCANLIRLSSMIFRLSNDLATSTEEQERGDVPTSIECYMNETKVSEIIAREHISSLIIEAWKEMNRECQSCSSFSQPFINASVNLARTSCCLYQNGDGFGVQTHKIKGHIKTLLFKPISLE